MSRFSKDDQKFYQKLTQNISVLPKATIEENSIVLKDNGYETKIEFLPGRTHEFKVNGYLWTYDPKSSLVPQVETLLRNHLPRKTSSYWIELFVPRAHAQVVLAGLGGAVITAVVIGLFANGGTDIVKKLGEQGICAPTRGNSGTNSFQPRNVGFCKDWDAAFQEKQRKKSPRLDAIVNLVASDKSNIFSKFKVDKTFSCPSNNDGKDRVYDANIQMLDEKSRIFEAKVILSPEGDVKDFSIFEVPNACKLDKDGVTPQWAACNAERSKNKKIAHIEFDKENYMKCLKMKSNSSDVLSPDEIALCGENASLTTTEKGKIDLVQDLVLFTNSVITKCTVEAAAQKVSEGKADQLGSPKSPKPNDVALPPKQEPLSVQKGQR